MPLLFGTLPYGVELIGAEIVALRDARFCDVDVEWWRPNIGLIGNTHDA